MIDKVEEIIWLVNPYIFDYIREGITATTQNEGSIGRFGARDFFKLIGFENVKKKGGGIQVYHRKFWWLKKYDKDCPEAIEKYQSGVSQPNEAIKPEDIIISKDVRIIKAYEIEKVVQECKYGNKIYKNEYRKAKEENKPFMVLIKGAKYAYFYYDMYSTDFDLTQKAVHELATKTAEFLNSFPKDYQKTIIKSSSWYGFGSVTGSTPTIRIWECRMLTKQLKNIIINPQNWKNIMEKYI